MARVQFVMAVVVSTASYACGGEDFTSDTSASSSGSATSSDGGAAASATSSGGAGAAGGTGGVGAGGQPTAGSGGVDPCGESAVCAAEPPEGWIGPVILFGGADAAPPCPSGWQSEIAGQFGAVAAPFSCAACSCALPTGLSCSTPVVKGFTGLNCPGSGATISLNANGTCLSFGGYESISRTASSPIGGSCTASGGALTPSAPVWAGQARVCTEPLAELRKCDGGICAPVGEAPFDSGACIYQEGEVACPQSFPVGLVVYRSVADTRACSACGCGDVNGVTCAATVTVYTGTGCASGASTLTTAGCKNATAVGSLKSASLTTATPQGGACPANGGQPAGGVAGDMPLTVCCTED
jgi:hypothetical protein